MDKAEELKQEFIRRYAPKRELTDNEQAYFRFIRKLDEYAQQVSREKCDNCVHTFQKKGTQGCHDVEEFYKNNRF